MSDKDDPKKKKKDDKEDVVTKEQFEKLQTQLLKNSEELKAMKLAKAEIVADRDELKKQLKKIDDDKVEDGATEETLKKLLAESKDREDATAKARKADRVKFKLEVEAQKMGLRDMSFLDSHLDHDKVSLDKQGNLIGGAEALKSMKETHSFLFDDGKKAIKDDPKVDPKNEKGLDTTYGAVKGKSAREMVQIQRARGEAYLESEKDNLPGHDGAGKTMGPDVKIDPAV